MTASTDLPLTRLIVEHGMAEGLHLGAQLYLSREGKVLADLVWGERRPGEMMTPDTLLMWMSSSKPVTAVAVAQQWEQGRIEIDAPVAKYIPEFGQKGKEAVTVRHVLTHTGGFRGTPFDFPEDDWDEIIRRIAEMPLEDDWEPGAKGGYHIHSGWFILAELVQRASDQPFGEYVRERIFEPIGMADSWIGVPAEQYRAYGERIGTMFNTSKQPAEPLYEDPEPWLTRPRPSANGLGPIRELGWFYEMLLAGGEREGARVLKPETIDLFTQRHRVDLYDETFKHTIDWGLGFIPNSAHHGEQTLPYGYGPHASEKAYGHSGNQSSAAFVDPAHDLVVAVIFNGMPGEPKHHRRIRATLRALYEDLGLAEQ